MECAGVTTEVIYRRESYKNSDYSLDLWKEVKKRWLVFGVLFSIMLAVLSPHVGAPGGNERMLLQSLETLHPIAIRVKRMKTHRLSNNNLPTGPLHMEYLSYAPLTYIYFNAGRRHRASAAHRASAPHAPSAPSMPSMHARVVAMSVLHAHVAAPALCVISVAAFQDVLDHRIVKGALFTSVGGPCAWLSLALSQSSAAPASIASSYALSLLAAPLAMLALCGRAAVPPIGHILTAVLVSLLPFLLGASRPASPAPPAVPQVAALVLVYADVSARLVEAEGTLYVGDVLTTLCLELCYAWSSVALCCAYARCGLLPARLAKTVAFCALPKDKHHGWEWSPQCGAWGLGSLPGVMRAPALALLLAAAAGDSDADPNDQ